MPEHPRNTGGAKKLGTNEGGQGRLARALRWLRDGNEPILRTPKQPPNPPDPPTAERGTPRPPATSGRGAGSGTFVAPECERGTCTAHRGDHIRWLDCPDWTPSSRTREALERAAASAGVVYEEGGDCDPGEQLEPPAAAGESEQGGGLSERLQEADAALRAGTIPRAEAERIGEAFIRAAAGEPLSTSDRGVHSVDSEGTSPEDHAMGLRRCRGCGWLHPRDFRDWGTPVLYDPRPSRMRISAEELADAIPLPPSHLAAQMFVRTSAGDVPMAEWLRAHPERPEAFRMFRESFSSSVPLSISGPSDLLEQLAQRELCGEEFKTPPALQAAARHAGRDHRCCRLERHRGRHLCTCGTEWELLPRPSAGDSPLAMRHAVALVEIAGLHHESIHSPPGWIGEPQRRCAEDGKRWPCPTALLLSQAKGPEAEQAKDPT